MSRHPFMERLGCFRIQRAVIDRKPADVLSVLAGMIVVRAEFRYEHDAVEYVAASWSFAPAPARDEPPRYVYQIDGDSITWRPDGL